VNRENGETRIERLLRLLAEEPVVPSRAFKARLVRLLQEALRQRQKSPWQRPALRWAAAALVLFIAAYAFFGHRTTVALLTVRKGEATVYREHTYILFHRQEETKVANGESHPLTDGDRITLSEEGNGVIAFRDGSVLELQGGTDLTLEQADEPMMTRIYLQAGEVWAQVVHLLDVNTRFEIRTPAAVVSVRGTVFRTQALGEESTYSATDEGATVVTLLDPSQGNPSVEVPAGYEVEAVVGQPLVVRPQTPEVEKLMLDDKSVKLDGLVASPTDELKISGRTEPGVDVVLVFYLNGQEIDRARVGPDGTFQLEFHPPAEGDYPLCVAVEDAEGRRSDCVSFTYRYDVTPPMVLRLLEPTTPEVTGDEVTLKGETEAGASLTLNGEPVPVAEDGHFAITVPLSLGDNPFLLESCDAAGNCASLDFTLTRR